MTFRLNRHPTLLHGGKPNGRTQVSGQGLSATSKAISRDCYRKGAKVPSAELGFLPVRVGPPFTVAVPGRYPLTGESFTCIITHASPPLDLAERSPSGFFYGLHRQ